VSDGSDECPEREKIGLVGRHPRLSILMLAALFLVPICAMVLVVAVLILR
jgi:hypothetical protein